MDGLVFWNHDDLCLKSNQLGFNEIHWFKGRFRVRSNRVMPGMGMLSRVGSGSGQDASSFGQAMTPVPRRRSRQLRVRQEKGGSRERNSD